MANLTANVQHLEKLQKKQNQQSTKKHDIEKQVSQTSRTLVSTTARPDVAHFDGLAIERGDRLVAHAATELLDRLWQQERDHQQHAADDQNHRVVLPQELEHERSWWGLADPRRTLCRGAVCPLGWTPCGDRPRDADRGVARETR